MKARLHRKPTLQPSATNAKNGKKKAEKIVAVGGQAVLTVAVSRKLFLSYVILIFFKIIVGPGAKKEAQLLGLGLAKLRSKQKDWLADAKKYAREQSIKQVLLRQTLAHQQNVSCILTLRDIRSWLHGLYYEITVSLCGNFSRR